MIARFAVTCLSLTLLITAVRADTDIVIDDFESYADATALQAAWPSSTGSTTSTFLTSDSGVYPGIDGQAAVFDGTLLIGAGSVNQWGQAISVAPSATQNVELTVDLGNDALTSNKKLTMGLRGPAGIIELGFWNQFPQGPNGEFFQFGYRNILFASGDTNWQPYSLDQSLDQVFEVGAGFHRFKAVISETDVTFTLDLFADGLTNAVDSADFDDDGDIDGKDFVSWQRGFGTGNSPAAGDANGDDVVDDADLAIWESQFGGSPAAPAPGVDATDIVPAVVNAGGFNDLRFGIPSAAGSSADPFLGVDNVSLRLVDIPLTSSASAAAVPEPSAAVLALLALAGASLAARRR